ncbi:TPA: type II secretion system minor pseudopilin GspH [Serratia odorifera]|nr:type II secretion system minor pseudopilin GspH [Serratia odorifera]
MNKKNSSGFSLLEIMLVLVLLGGVATLVIGALPGQPALQQHQQHLSAQLQWANERAVQEGQVYGLAVAAREWQLVKLVQTSDGGQPSYYWPGRYWQPVDNGRSAQLPPLPEGASLQLLLEGHELPLSSRLHDQGLEPRILFMPGGEVSGFELRLLAENQPPRIIAPEPGSVG